MLNFELIKKEIEGRKTEDYEHGSGRVTYCNQNPEGGG
jgi:hypothetical protein